MSDEIYQDAEHPAPSVEEEKAIEPTKDASETNQIVGPDEALGYAVRFLQARRFADAQEVLNKIFTVLPKSAPALHVQAALHCETGKLDAAQEILTRLLEDSPEEPSYLNTWGRLCALQGRDEEAQTGWARAIEKSPQDPSPYLNRAELARDQGRFEEAIQDFERALRLRPVFPQAAWGLAQTKVLRDGWAAAVPDYQRALAQAPDDPNIRFQLSKALGASGHPHEELKQLNILVERWPLHWAAQLNLSSFAEVAGDYEKAFTHLQAAESCLEIDPNADRIATSVLGLRLRRSICDWEGIEPIEKELTEAVSLAQKEGLPVPAINPFMTLYTAFDAASQKAVASRAAHDVTPQISGPAFGGAAQNGGRLRIGYMIADLRNHPNAQNTLRLYGLHDRERFEVFTYSWGTEDQEEINQFFRRQVMDSSEHFVELKGYSDAEMAKRIASDGIQILIDLMGVTGNNRLGVLARRPAPVQVTYLGYPGTTGADFVDYILGDAWVTPFDRATDFSEKIIQLPHSYQINSHSTVTFEKSFSRTDVGLPEAGFVYVCFNSSYKITQEVFIRWMRILTAVPDSVLWLLRTNDHAETNLRKQARALDVDPERLIFAPFWKRDAHLSRLSNGGLALDTTPYGAHTTASDALWAGVPVLTVPGETFASRVTASILQAAQLPDAVLPDWDVFEERAIALATTDLDILEQWRRVLRKDPAKLPIFDTAAQVKALEAAYKAIWKRYQQKNPSALCKIHSKNLRCEFV